MSHPTSLPSAQPGSMRRPVTGRGLAAAAGVAAGSVVLGVADLLAQAVAPSASPVVAVGEAFIDRTPGALKDVAIRTFGSHDKQALLLGMAAVLLALTAATGLLARRRAALGQAAAVLLGAVAAGAALSRPGATPAWALPAATGTLAGCAALRLLLPGRRGEGRRHPAAAAPAGEDGRDESAPTRRRSVLAVAGVSALAVLTGGAGRVLAATRRLTRGPADLTLPPPASPAAAVPAGATLDGDAALTAGGLTPFATPVADFYRVDTALVVPRIDAAGWRLRVHGDVERELDLDIDDVLALPLVERWITLTCVSNEVGGTLAGNQRWLGARLADLLATARPRPGADMVLSTSADGWTASTPLAALTDGRDALLAVGMDGAALPFEHGFPVRMVVPGLYGFVSATKWLVDLEVTRFDRAQAYWTRRGWSPQAPIKTFSRIDVPRAFATVAPGEVRVGGVAWAQHRGLRGVEVRVDGGTWQPARVTSGGGLDTWAQWSWTWPDATPGTHTLQVRATDATGGTQPEQRRPPKPDGATGWHSVSVRVR
ncbi:MAG: molybdopterin-dependent oxidoreductase [Kineosporiaceae bacterium]